MEAPFPHAGELAALATACCWTTSALAFEAAGRRVGSLALNLIRLVPAALLLAAYSWVVRGVAFPVDASAHAWLWLSLSGLVGFTVGDLCLFRAFVRVGARVSMLLMATVPPITTLLGLLIMDEVLSPRQLLGMALAVAGVSSVVLERRPDAAGRPQRLPADGILLGLGGAVGQSLGLVLSKVGMGSYDAFAATQIRVLAGIAGLAVVFTVIGWWPRVKIALADRPAMLPTGIGAFFGPFLGVSLSLVAIKYAFAGVAATLMALVPVLIIPASVLVFGERVSRTAVLGAVVAVAGGALLF
ncbi:MAG TPA: DMT family transporter [Thermoanaerobaculales bacterium]|nr:DMT family transporter [Thermoanaerobaculales bacterium]HPA79497.1 DMT family transporter [Thermoanaerobaculales bacterium]HQL29690.1 DMT family transporter [Thermoanaerobaculales bacterium]HQN95424.1 DMT family transporter [Thermoanaerobaculales bacterium]HQP44876.1 DMT family transporter [Thermoanaerobaculales bacterium]